MGVFGAFENFEFESCDVGIWPGIDYNGDTEFM